MRRGPFSGAEDRARTGHPDLGKVVLYQMSYFRLMCKNCFPFGCAKIASDLLQPNFLLNFLFVLRAVHAALRHLYFRLSFPAAFV